VGVEALAQPLPVDIRGNTRGQSAGGIQGLECGDELTSEYLRERPHRGELLLGNQMQEVRLDRRRIKRVRRESIVLGQCNDAAQVRLLRPFGKAPQHHRVVHPIAQFAHLVLLIRIGNSPNEKDRNDGSPLQSASPRMTKAPPIQHQLRWLVHHREAV
jgi:hypothetical protein